MKKEEKREEGGRRGKKKNKHGWSYLIQNPILLNLCSSMMKRRSRSPHRGILGEELIKK